MECLETLSVRILTHIMTFPCQLSDRTQTIAGSREVCENTPALLLSANNDIPDGSWRPSCKNTSSSDS